MEQTQTPDNTADQKRTNKLKLVWGLIGLIGPTALVIVSLLAYAGLNLLLGTSSPISTVINIALYIVGVIAILSWLPAVVIGIVLLATRKKVQ